MNGQHSSNNNKSDNDDVIVEFEAVPTGSKCPFGNTIRFALKAGGCVCLKGPSGRGKTTLATTLADLPAYGSVLKKLQIDTKCQWNSSIPARERCGVLFQQTTLLDDLTVAGNLQVALNLHHDKFQTKQDRDRKLKQLLDAVGLSYDRDASKRPTELSGGMGRRASLALQLAQRKRVIILDEPFTGLDYDAAISVAKELVHLRQTQNTALILISHEPHLSKIVMDDKLTSNNVEVELTPPNTDKSDDSGKKRALFFGTTFRDRFFERLLDYTFWSLPLIVTAFGACGLAVSMMNADLLGRIEINDRVIQLIDKEVRPLIKMLTGEEATALQMMGIKFKVNGMLNQTVPPAKATLYAIGLTNLFVLEVGPLLTALLLCGRIGGSYAGKVGTMQATSQNKLLRTLGVNPQWWTLWPSLLAAIIAAPLLTTLGTALALYLGGIVGPQYGIGTTEKYMSDLKDTLWPILRLESMEPLWAEAAEDDPAASAPYTIWNALSSPKLWTVTHRQEAGQETTLYDMFIELATYPPIYHLFKSSVFILIIMLVSETIARIQPNLTPRGVPSVITFSVVMSGLLVILADWGFSQLWLLRY